MKHFLPAAIFVAVACSFAAAPEARAWGCEGHQTIALIAEKHLDPHALAMVEQILKDNPIDPTLSRYCKPLATDPLADSATWADDYREVHKETEPWHYFDIPRGAKRRNIDQYCPADKGCLITVLKEQISILESAGADEAQKAQALRFVIHLVGDIHQPLHTTTNSDKGGNCIPVTFFGETPKPSTKTPGDYYPYLHTIWDSGMIDHIAQGKTVDQFAAQLDQQFQSKFQSWENGPVNFDNWAWESHVLAEQVAYGDLPVKIPIEPPVEITSCLENNNISARMLKLNEVLGADYQNAAAPVIEEQLAKAGIRLSMILNQIWP